ncbi:DUF4124 domain-containing protein [Aurantivibrio plasticivorans]
MLKILPIIALFIMNAGYTSYASATDIYKTVDENGNVTFTDTPTGESPEKVDVQPGNRMPATIARPPQAQKPKVNPQVRYQVTINSPANEYHLTPGQRSLSIAVSTKPTLLNAHQIIITDNGSIVDGDTINNITPGTHSIGARVVDSKGKILGQAKPVTVYVHRVTKARAGQ